MYFNVFNSNVFKFICSMVLFALFLTYEGETTPRKVADGCSKSQVLDILSRHLLLVNVAHFQIVPFDYYIPFKDYSL